LYLFINMPLRPASQEEIKNWNRLIISNPDGGHFLQSLQWGDFKKEWDWRPLRFIFENDSQKIAIQILEKKTFMGRIWYCPKGPGLTSFSAKFWPDIIKSFAEAGRKNNAFVLKIEPEVIETEEEIKNYAALDLVKSKEDLQFKATIFVDLKKPEEEILASFKPKTRYNIRLSQKHGVSVREDSSRNGMEILYGLFSETGKRAGFFQRPKEYYCGYWKKCVESDMGKIFIAEFKNEPLAALFAYRLGKKFWYKDGGSSRKFREAMAPYLLQWEAMRWAKKNGYEIYDLVAVPPKNQLNEKNPLWGLYKFKSGFNPDIAEFVGCLDLPIKKQRYALWTKLESRYSTIYKKISKNAFY
jgi:peptidoglycan pentaglycine glycine transferase (the first glycine)